MEIIDFSAFERALKSLEEVIEIYKKDENNLIVRDSLIQRFEYTYSLSLKMIKRIFKESAFVEGIEEMTFAETIRLANKMNLLKSNLEKWAFFREKRNLTSHTYNEITARSIVPVIFDFFEECEYLLERLKERK